MQSEDFIRILFLGDVVGRAGRRAVESFLKRKRGEFDFVIVNGENAAGGFGITPKVAEELFSFGVDVITSGNHVWNKKEIIDYLRKSERLLRPLNYPPNVPGRGSVIVEVKDEKIGVINGVGRVFMKPVDCPFRVISEEARRIRELTPNIIVDFHAEATSEKIAMGFYLDGLVSAIVGTHTHVQTSDERILPNGSAYITDAGMVGSINSVIGMEKKDVIYHFLTQIPQKFKAAKGEVVISGVYIEVDPKSGNAISIKRVSER